MNVLSGIVVHVVVSACSHWVFLVLKTFKLLRVVIGVWYKHLYEILAYIELFKGAGCSSVVRTFAHGVMGRRIDPSWGGTIELFLVPASAPRLV